MAALTPNDPAFQPGFGAADTSVTGGIGLYGYYGPLDGDLGMPSSPLGYVGADAPPFFVAHGDADTFVPMAGARCFVERLRSASTSAVVYAELPGGSTRSTCSTPCGSRRSSTGSRPSQPGCDQTRPGE